MEKVPAAPRTRGGPARVKPSGGRDSIEDIGGEDEDPDSERPSEDCRGHRSWRNVSDVQKVAKLVSIRDFRPKNE